MVVAKYPATHGHTTVIDNLCIGLSKLGYTTAIGAFSFSSNPPNNIKMIKLSKFQLLHIASLCKAPNHKYLNKWRFQDTSGSTF